MRSFEEDADRETGRTAAEVDALWDRAAWGMNELDLAAKMQHARLRARLLGESYQAPTVGRFSILRKLGEGGMGEVYAAYDDQLDRKVALKFLHPARAGDERAVHRLLREAQALAKLSHPHLVPVFDVGRFDDRVYLAMEMVPGVTMREWTAEAGRPWRKVLERWVEVGRALVAVHEAGMVHRDLKPDNVLVGQDGRARLVDFGLARGQGAHPTVAEVDARADDCINAGDGRRRLEERVTQTHDVVGTPAYMAPEVRRGEPATESSDQYGLCVSIYESLVGQRPTGPTRARALVRVPATVRMSLALRRALSRGLTAEPAERYPSTRALLHDLERVLGHRRGRLLTRGAALLVAAGVGATLVRTTEVGSVALCQTVQDELRGVWDEARRTAVSDGIAATRLPYAEPLARELVARTDDYARAWLDARTRVCEATWVHQVQSEALLDRRMSCLDQQRTELAAFVDAAAGLEGEQPRELPRALTTLGVPEECESPMLLELGDARPPAANREQIESLRREVADLRVAALLRGPVAVRGRAQAVYEQAERLGFAPLRARAELMLGFMHFLGDDPRAHAHLLRAEALAEAAGDDRLREEASRMSARLWALLGTDLDRAREAHARNRAIVARLGDPPHRLAALEQAEALLLQRQGDLAGAEASQREAIARWSALGERFASTRATAWRGLGRILCVRGRYHDAEQAFERAARIDARWGGSPLDRDSGRTRAGMTTYVRGVAAMGQGELDEASTLLHEALDEAARAYGPDSVPVGRVHVSLAQWAMQTGRIDDVLAHARVADDSVRRWLGDDHVLRRSPLSALGTAAFHRGLPDVAVDAFAEALRLQQTALPDDHLDLAIARSNLGEAQVLAGREEEAQVSLHAALAVMERRLPDTDARLSYPLHALGESLLRQGQLRPACDHAERALWIREQHRDDLVELARTRWLVARCELARGRPARARPLAESARTVFRTMGKDFADEVEAIDAALGPTTGR
ncbi:MAG: tetratricopeptide repeat protein [Myxococcota bacterium]